MELAGAGFDDHGDSSGRREAVVGTVVGSQLTELSHGFARRGRGYAATAAAVVILTAVDHEYVMGRALAIEADARITANGNVLVIGDIARCSGSQRSKLEQAGAVDREVRYLPAGDQVADFPSIGLHGYGVGFDSNRFLCAADGQGKVDSATVADRQRQGLPLGNLEARGFHPYDVVSDVKVRGHILAVAAGSQLSGQSGVYVGDGDGRIRHSRASRIGNCTEHGGFLCECGNGEYREEKENHAENRNSTQIAVLHEFTTPG